MNNHKIAAILIAAITSSVHSQEIRNVHDSAGLKAEKQVQAKKASEKAKPSGDSAKKCDVLKAKERPQNSDKADSGQQRPKNELYYYDVVKSLIADFGNLILAIIATGALGVSLWLVVETRRGIRRQLRAYVGQVDTARKPIRGATEVVVMNYGKTPAKDFVGLMRISRKAVSLACIQALTAKDDHPRDVLFPMQMNGLIEDRDIPDREEYFVYGKLTYLDVFDASHVTTFQIKVLPGDKRLSWHIGNSAT